MGRFASGVTVITATADGRIRGMTASAFMSGSLDPPLCLVSVSTGSGMCGHLVEAGRFGVNILGSEQQRLAMHFGVRPVAGLEVALGDAEGIPILADAAARLTADTVAIHPCGDHMIFVGQIRRADADERLSLLYHTSRFAALVTDAESASVPEL